MARVAPINLTFNPQTLWFDPGDVSLEKDDKVVVETARGLEFGTMAQSICEVSDEQINALKSPLKPVVRKATEEDCALAEEFLAKGQEALVVFKDMAAELEVDMRPVSVEFLIDGEKAIFYFESEERVDFRELVRKLAAHFHVRIDMRQIGVRDEARMVGGLGHCGQELCCKRLGGEFSPVSIRMAKEQDLSLNPQKISGLCGRLMCCLRYEYDAYKDFKGRAPKCGACIHTPAGEGKVTSLDVPREVVTVSVEGEKPLKVPLAYFDDAEEGTRPNSISEAGWEEAKYEGSLESDSAALSFATSQFTGSDNLAKKGSIRHFLASKKGDQDNSERESSQTARIKRSSNRRGRSEETTSATRTPRRRRSTTIDASTAREGEQITGTSADLVAAADGSMSEMRKADSVRQRRPRKRISTRNEAAEAASEQTSSSQARKSRNDRMSRKGHAQRTSREQKQKGADARKTQANKGVRPGQRSSGLSQKQETTSAKPDHKRRPRRRSNGKHPSQGSADKAE